MAIARLDWAGYEFGVTDLDTGKTTWYPDHTLACQAYWYLKDELNRAVEFTFRALYLTPPMKAKEPKRPNDPPYE
jgi:hypothetical protein